MRALLRTLAVVTLAATALSGCSMLGPVAPIPSATLEQLDAPAELTEAGRPVSLSQHISPGSAHHPWVIGGSRRNAQQEWKPAYWSSLDGRTWRESVLDELEGRASVSFRSSAELLAFAGTVWHEGFWRSVVITSADAEAWRDIALPAGFAQRYRIGSFDVHGDEVIAIGTDASGAARGIRVAGEQVHEFDVPSTGDKPFNAVAVVRSGDTVLLLAAPGLDSEPQPTLAFISHDLGLNWQGPGQVADALDGVSGVVAVSDGFVATGRVKVPGEDRSDPAAWFSADGLSWTRELVPASEQGWLSRDSGMSSLDLPNQWNDVVGATLTNSESLVNQAYRRSPAGTWATDVAFNLSKGIGQAGAVLHADDFSVGLVTGNGGSRIGRIENSRWRVAELLTERADREVLGSALTISDGVILVSERPVFTSSPVQWSNQQSTSHYRVQGDRIETTTLDTPAEVKEPWFERRGSEEVILGFDSESGTARGWHREAGTEWAPVHGLSPDRITTFRELIASDDGWFAAGSTRASRSDNWRPTAWFSPNGVDWSTTDIPGSHDDVGVRWISGVCRSPDGAIIAVGTEERQPERFRAVAWTVESGTLVPTTSAVFGEGHSYSGLCAEAEDGMVARITVEGRPSLYWSADGLSWEPALVPEPGSSADTPIAVTGGLVAIGYYQDGDFASPVLWLSRDGRSWSPVQLPGIGNSTPNAVVQSGDDLLLLLDEPGIAPVAVIRDIDELIESTAR